MEPETLKSAAAALAELRDDPWFPYPQAVDLLMAFGEGGVPDLVAALEDPEPRIRSVAVRALGASDSEEAAAAIARALRDPSAEVKRAAAAAIADRTDARWVAALSDLLAGEDETARLTAAQVLGQLGAPAVDALAEALDQYEGDDPWLPGALVEALGTTGAAQALEPLVAALGHRLAHVRQSAIEALVMLGSPAHEIVHALHDLADDEAEDTYLRQLAAAAVEDILTGPE